MNERLRYRFAAEACVFAQGLLPPPHRIQRIDKKLGRRTSQVAAKELGDGGVGGVGGAGGVVVVGVVVGGCCVGGGAVSDGGGVHLVVFGVVGVVVTVAVVIAAWRCSLPLAHLAHGRVVSQHLYLFASRLQRLENTEPERPARPRTD